MKNTWYLLPAFMIFLCGLPAKGQSTVPDATPRSSFFIKAGGGFDIFRITFKNYYDRPVVGNFDQEEDRDWIGVSDFTGSVAGGVEFPDSFSLFVSSEWFQNDGSALVNAQLAFWGTNFMKAYFFGGLGMDFNSGALGPALQIGLGSEFPLEKNLGIYVEGKGFFVHLEYRNNSNAQQNFESFEIFTPLLAGLKYKL